MTGQTLAHIPSSWQALVPDIAWGTIALFTLFLGGYLLVIPLVLSGNLAYGWASVICSVLVYIGFTIGHDAGHGAIVKSGSALKPLENVLGWCASLPLLLVPFPLFKLLHDRHHAFTNDPYRDPDYCEEGGRWYQIILHCFYIPIRYYKLTFTTLRSDASIRRKIPLTIAYVALLTITFSAAVLLGYGKAVLYLILIPSLVALFALALFFDYLPHRPHTALDRYNNARIVPSKLLNLLLLGQNYHLVHHLYPKVPWYMYQRLYHLIEPELIANQARIDRLFDPQHSSESMPGTINHVAKVVGLKKLCKGVVSVELLLPSNVSFAYQAGQYITVSHYLAGALHTRCYSLYEPPTSHTLKIAVRLEPEGLMSSFINHQLKVNQTLIVKGPFGDFVYPPQHSKAVNGLTLIAAGSGITPIMAILRAALNGQDCPSIKLIYCASNVATMMFNTELQDLLQQYSNRLTIQYVLSQERTRPKPISDGISVVCGKRLNKGLLLEALQENNRLNQTESEFYLCGPDRLCEDVYQALREIKVEPLRIHRERFQTVQQAPQGNGHQVLLHLINGQTDSLSVASNQTVLDVAKSQGVTMQHACGTGTCGSCKCKITKGRAKPIADTVPAITRDEQALGITLACQCQPLTELHLQEIS
ncbi:MAG: fatty acid desaturase [Aestuariibacter sp.]